MTKLQYVTWERDNKLHCRIFVNPEFAREHYLVCCADKCAVITGKIEVSMIPAYRRDLRYMYDNLVSYRIVR